MSYLTELSAQMGISFWLLIVILLWSVVWKLLALWKSARKNHLGWFIVMAVVNTVGILPILYIYVFSKIGYEKIPKKAVKRKVVKKKIKRKK